MNNMNNIHFVHVVHVVHVELESPGLGMDQINHTINNLQHQSLSLKVRYRTLLDRSIPFIKERWAGLGVLFFLFMLRVVLAQGWYVECYALSIFILNLFLGFLSPKFSQDLQDDIASDEMESGLNANSKDDEFKPFIRRVPEFHFWLLSFYGTLAALASTITRITDIPVYWPILVVYFFVLLFLTMRRQIEHMIKYKYVPFDFGKKRFARK